MRLNFISSRNNPEGPRSRIGLLCDGNSTAPLSEIRNICVEFQGNTVRDVKKDEHARALTSTKLIAMSDFVRF